MKEKEFPAGSEQIYQGLLQDSGRQKSLAESCSLGVDGLDGPSGLIQHFPHAMGHSAPGADLNPQAPAAQSRAQVSSRAVALGQCDPHTDGAPSMLSAWGDPSLSKAVPFSAHTQG